MRERLPDRRRTWTQKAKLPDFTGKLQTFYLSAGEYPDGRLGEIWIEAHAEGTFTRGVLASLARVASIALQHGVPVEAIVSSLRNIDFPPNGKVQGSALVGEATSVCDWVGRELEAVYLVPKVEATAV